MMPTAPMEAALGGLAQATQVGVSTLARKLSKEGQAEERQNAEDLDALKRNAFGPSKAQQESAVQDALNMARAQTQSARAEAARTANARSYRAPDTLTPKLVQANAAQAGQLRMQQSNTAAQQAAQQKADAFARVSNRAQDTYNKVASIHQAGQDAYAKAGGSGGGMAQFGDWTKAKGAYA